jgi:hypothetical protein
MTMLNTNLAHCLVSMRNGIGSSPSKSKTRTCSLLTNSNETHNILQSFLPFMCGTAVLVRRMKCEKIVMKNEPLLLLS